MMSFLGSVVVRFSRDRRARSRGERDAPAGLGMAGSRETGGEPNADVQDQNSTTGTTPSADFVGRASGDESGDVGLSGGEARTGQRADGRTGAARDE